MMESAGWIIATVATVLMGAVVVIVLLSVRRTLEGTAAAVRDELRGGREEQNNEARQQREEIAAYLRAGNEAVAETLKEIGKQQDSRSKEFHDLLLKQFDQNENSLDRVRRTMDERVKELQESNEKKLDEMRLTVDEKLHDTLEKRLGESFSLVSDRLEAVHKGLGEMQSLATGVGDLKRVLSNVKQRGTIGESQLGAILEEILSPQQYETNVAVKPGSAERVEFAIRLPANNGDPNDRIYLPIDSKYPQEDYLRILDASERGDAEAVQRAVADLARTVKNEARTICDKYIAPPFTTDLAIMFVPTEGLYAEIAKQPSLLTELDRLRVIVAGPLTLSAILNSLRLGFQTMAIEARAGEVRQVLSAVKTEFGKFGAVLSKVKKQLGTATRTIEETEQRARAMDRRLRTVEQLPEPEAAAVLALSPSDDGADDSGFEVTDDDERVYLPD